MITLFMSYKSTRVAFRDPWSVKKTSPHSHIKSFKLSVAFAAAPVLFLYAWCCLVAILCICNLHSSPKNTRVQNLFKVQSIATTPSWWYKCKAKDSEKLSLSLSLCWSFTVWIMQENCLGHFWEEEVWKKLLYLCFESDYSPKSIDHVISKYLSTLTQVLFWVVHFKIFPLCIWTIST